MRTRTLRIHSFILYPLYCFRCVCFLFCTRKIQSGCIHLLVSAFVCFHLYFICTQLFTNARFVSYQFAFFQNTKCGAAHAQQIKKSPKMARNKFKTRYKFVIFTNLLCRANSLWSFRMTENDVTSLCGPQCATIKFCVNVRSINLLLSIELCTYTHSCTSCAVCSVTVFIHFPCTVAHRSIVIFRIVHINRCIDGFLLCCF